MTVINLAALLVLGIMVVSVVVAVRREPGDRGGVLVVAGIAVVLVFVALVWAISSELSNP